MKLCPDCQNPLKDDRYKCICGWREKEEGPVCRVPGCGKKLGLIMCGPPDNIYYLCINCYRDMLER